MFVTIAIILVATIALAAFEIWLFWRVGERDDRRRSRARRRATFSASGTRRGRARVATVDQDPTCAGGARRRDAFLAGFGRPDRTAFVLPPLDGVDHAPSLALGTQRSHWV